MSAAPQILIAIGGIFALLIAATGIVWTIDRRPGTELKSRVRSWWVMIAVFTVAILADRAVSSVFLGFLSFLALKEYFSLIPSRRIDRGVLLLCYLAIPVQFTWAHMGWYGMFVVFIPVWMFLVLPVVMTLMGDTKGFLTAVGTLSWGLMMTVFALSHAALLLAAGELHNGAAGGAGLLLFLVFTTQLNDVAQFVWGKLIGGTLTGERGIVPSVSPNKTWEGFLGGLVTSALVAMLTGPYLTMMDWRWSALAGAMIACAGFVGDVTISALKRDLGVKDSGGLIPGHGGILDRVDSLTYAAPVFLHFLVFFFMSGRGA